MSKHYFPAPRRKDGSVIATIGEAQRSGYVNRSEHRYAKKMEARKQKISNNFSMGVMRVIPVPPKEVIRRRKLKYWQKVA